jgi:NAD+ synthase (glutamine-hydrolysing)
MKIAIAQIQLEVANLEGNFQKISNTYNKYKNQVDIVLFPELAITGYGALDIINRKSFQNLAQSYNEKIKQLTSLSSAAIAIGNILLEDSKVYNTGLFFYKGKLVFSQKKVNLPNYGIFEEQRQFAAGDNLKIFTFLEKKILYLVCEDMWYETCLKASQDADFILVSNASPFEVNKTNLRIQMAKRFNKPIVYVNHIMAQDDIVFDGASFAINGDNIEVLKSFKEEIKVININNIKTNIKVLDENLQIYEALKLALKEYVRKNGFKKVLIGLSGGIDSTLTCFIAKEALGKENVILYFLPSKFTSKKSYEDSYAFAKNLKLELNEININFLFESFQKTLNLKNALSLQNLQARIRGNILMAVSNEINALLLTTGNKSELATGYCTLYGDTCGGFNLLKDLYKTKVFELSKYLGLPKNIVEKEPTAELAENQKDEDSLGAYEVLDKILHLYIEQSKSQSEIIALGFDEKMVKKTIKLVLNSDYKRKQSAIGPKISKKPFTSDWHYPITKSIFD